jgi:RHS repeat-associated protein
MNFFFLTSLKEKHNPKYNSQELDTETDFYYYNARYYDPEISRFVTADTVIDGEHATQGWNRYMYVKGNPIKSKDSDGHEETSFSNNGEVTGYSKSGDIGKAATNSFVKQNAGGSSNHVESASALVEVAQGVTASKLGDVLKSRAMVGSVQYSTDVVTKAIENVMTSRLNEFNKTGDKKLLKLTSGDIVNEAMNTKVPENMILPTSNGFTADNGYGNGKFKNGKTIKESIDTMGDDKGIQLSKQNIKNIAESFIKGPDALKKTYDDASKYWGPDSLKLIRMDSMSGIREDQYKSLLEKRKEFDLSQFNK